MPNKDQIREQYLTQLNTLAQEGKYKELAELLVNVNAQTKSVPPEQKEEYEVVDAKTEAMTSFYLDLTKLTDDNKITPEKRAIVKGLYKEFADIRMRSIINTGVEYDKWKEKINNGEIDVVNIIKDDDPHLADDIAYDIALFKTESGRKLYGSFKAHKGLASAINDSPEWKQEVKSQDIKCYGPVIEDPTKSEVVMNVFNEYPDISLDNKKKYFEEYIINPQAKAKSYNLKPNFTLDNGKIEFISIPDDIKNIVKAKSCQELDVVKKSFEDKIKTNEKFIGLSRELAASATEKVNTLESNGEQGYKNNEAYTKFMDSLKNLTKIGTDFKVKVGQNFFTIKETIVHMIADEIKKTAELGKAYYDSLKNAHYTDKEDYRKHREDVKNTISFLNDKFTVFKADGLKLPVSSLEKDNISNNKQIARINKYADAKGFTAADMKDARINTRLGEYSTALDKSIEKAIAANNVHTKHKDYDDAVTAMQQLSLLTKAYKQLRDGSHLTEAQRDKIEQLREQAKEAQEKINKYVERKEKEKAKKKGKLDAKGANRLSVLKNALDLTYDIVDNMDKSTSALDTATIERERNALESEMNGKIAVNLNSINQESAMADDNNTKVAGAAAASGLSAIKQAIDAGGEITPDKQAQLREAAIKYALFVGKGYNTFGELTAERYDQIIKETASDPRFADQFGNITREQLQSLSVDGENTFLTSVYHNFVAVNDMRTSEQVAQQKQSVLNEFEERRKQLELEKQAEIDEISGIGYKTIEKLDEIANSTGETNADRFNEEPVSWGVQAAQFAKEGMSTLINTINDDDDLEPDDIQVIREAYAALAIQSMNNANADTKISYDDYLTQVRSLAGDNDFIRTVGNIEKSDIMSFIKDEKAPAKLMDQVISTKKFSKGNEKNIVHGQAPAVKTELNNEIKQGI